MRKKLIDMKNLLVVKEQNQIVAKNLIIKQSNSVTWTVT